MNSFWKAAPWFVRGVLLVPTLIFAMIAFRYLAHPVAAAGAQGMILPGALGITIARVGLGGFPLGCSLFLVFCQISRRLLAGLAFVEIMLGVLVSVRLFGMFADSTVRENLKLVNIEIALLALTTIALFVEIRRKAGPDHAELERPARAA